MGVDLQAGFTAGGTEQLMHPRGLFRRTDIELVQDAAGPLFFKNFSLNAAARKQFLRGQDGAVLFGL